MIVVVSDLRGYDTLTGLGAKFMKMCEDSNTDVEDMLCHVSSSYVSSAGILRRIRVSRDSKSICAQLCKYPV